MSIISYFNRIRTNILKRQIDKVQIPKFQQSNIVRKSLIFSGKVQSVGFRFETQQMSNKLNLTGWVKNKSDGTVEAEVQGEEEKIEFLIDHLKSLKRIKIQNIEIKEISIIEVETKFKIV